jgi:hypothetical protein
VAPGRLKVRIKERPSGSNTHQFVIKGKGATLLSGPPSVGTHEVAIEFSTPLCFRATATTCVKKPTSERCS